MVELKERLAKIRIYGTESVKEKHANKCLCERAHGGSLKLHVPSSEVN